MKYLSILLVVFIFSGCCNKDIAKKANSVDAEKVQHPDSLISAKAARAIKAIKK